LADDRKEFALFEFEIDATQDRDDQLTLAVGLLESDAAETGSCGAGRVVEGRVGWGWRGNGRGPGVASLLADVC
jgi:hypothetical protein